MPTIPSRAPKPQDHDPFYGTTRWRKFRAWFFRTPEHNLCRCCQGKGISTIAFILDHILPRRLFPELEWEATNMQGLCRTCDQQKRNKEKGIATREQAYIILKEYL